MLLLLFLLGTLGGLYRYSLRIAGFHHARADALKLLTLPAFSDPGAPPDPDAESPPPGATDPTRRYAALVEALAAEKVEFARARAPIDAVVDLAREAGRRIK